MDKSFADKVVLVTGSNSGIGETAALALSTVTQAALPAQVTWMTAQVLSIDGGMSLT